MGKEHFEFARIASPEEIAEYLSSLAVGIKRGDVTLEAGERSLRLTPAGEVKLEIRVKDREDEGKLTLQLGWKRQQAPLLRAPAAADP